MSYPGRPRQFAEPQVGETFGTVRVVAVLGRGHKGRSDLRVRVKCVACGHLSETYEFNLRADRKGGRCCKARAISAERARLVTAALTQCRGSQDPLAGGGGVRPATARGSR